MVANHSCRVQGGSEDVDGHARNNPRTQLVPVIQTAKGETTMQNSIEGIKKAVIEGKVNSQAVREMRKVLESSNIDENKVRKAVWDAIDWQVHFYLSKRYCSKEDVITSTVLGLQDWLCEEYKKVPSQTYSAFIRKKVSVGLDDIVVQVSKAFKKDNNVLALLVADSVKGWLDKTYAENDMQ